MNRDGKYGRDIVLPKVHNFELSPEPEKGEDLIAHSQINWDPIAPMGTPDVEDISYGALQDSVNEGMLTDVKREGWEPVKNRVTVASVLYPMIGYKAYVHHMEFIYNCGRRNPDYEFALAYVARSEIDRARNRLVYTALEAKSEFLYFYDTDTHMPSDLMTRMLEVMTFDENIVAMSPLYHVRGYPFELMVFKESHYEPILVTLKEAKKHADEHGLYDAWGLGCGTTLTRVSTFAQWNGPWYRTTPNHTEDAWFCSLARRFNPKARFVVDTTIEAGHELNEPVVIRTSNAKHLKKMFGPSGWYQETTQG